MIGGLGAAVVATLAFVLVALIFAGAFVPID